LTGEVETAPVGPAPGSFEDVMALLARTMRSMVIDVPGQPDRESAQGASRRILFIELTSREEAWIEDLFAQRLRRVSATR
jgi:hypothetical protein